MAKQQSPGKKSKSTSPGTPGGRKAGKNSSGEAGEDKKAVAKKPIGKSPSKAVAKAAKRAAAGAPGSFLEGGLSASVNRLTEEEAIESLEELEVGDCVCAEVRGRWFCMIVKEDHSLSPCPGVSPFGSKDECRQFGCTGNN